MSPARIFQVIVALLSCGLLFTAAPAEVSLDSRQVWTATGGQVQLELRADYLPDFGLEIVHEGRPIERMVGIEHVFVKTDHLVIEAPYGNFERIRSGEIRLDTGWVLRHGDREVRLDGLTLTPGIHINGHPSLEARDGAGRHLLTFHHMHILAEHDRDLLTLHNAGFSATSVLADLLDLAVLDGLDLGMAWFDLHLSVPFGADTSGRGPDCDDRPLWPQDGHKIDVAMWEMNSVQYQGQDPNTGRIKVAPDATLKNVGPGDVPWIPKFGSLGMYPYTPPDQHPYLVWNMYRISDERIEQLGASGAKHAFLTLNMNCSINCGNSNVLWPGCEDVYSAGTNDSNFNQGPRADIEASEGLFFSTCSFFDPDCTGSQTHNSGSYENRLMVDPDQLQTDDADYFLDAWYVIQYDIDIWNSMAYRSLDPQPSGNGWSFGQLGPFTEGRVLDQWVDPDDPGPDADHVAIVVPSDTPDEPYPDNMPQGHVNVAVRVFETEAGYRYNYALQNFDFDRGIEAFRVPFPEGAQLMDSHFGGVDGEPGDDWSVTLEDGYLSFEAPDDHPLNWFKLFNFEFETDLPPSASEITLDLGEDAVVPTWSEAMLGPDPDMQSDPGETELELVFPAGSFDFPLALRHAGDDSGRRFVVERNGVIRIVDADDNILPDPFLDISAQVNTTFEGGLLGLAFHPDFSENGKFFVNFTSSGSPLTTRIVRFEIDSTNSDQADPASQLDILSISQPAANHNGGDLHFGPDGYLYIGMGDGGPSSTSQDPESLLGSMLRIDIDDDDFPGDPDRNYAIPSDNPFIGESGLDETWAYGLRNPYRFSFDRDTGDLWISDVGQVTWEEINLQPAGDPGGQNYGWDVCEGAWQTGSTTVPCDLPGSTLPVIEYRRISPHCSVTGGYRYRGPIASLQGSYVYGDYCSGQVWLAEEDDGEWISEEFEALGNGLVGFGEDEDGHVYVLLSDGEIWRFEAPPGPAPQLDSVNPDHGSTEGGTAVTLAGENFLSGADVQFGDSACQDIEVISATEISCLTPAGDPGSVDVTVTNSDDQSDTLVEGFTYVMLTAPALTLSSEWLEFGDIQAGDQDSLELVLENTGTATLEVSSLELPAAPFSVDADDCGGSDFELAPDQSCELIVTFAPSLGGEFDDQLTILSNADSSPDTVALTGTGTQDSGDLEVTPLGLNFEDVFIGRSESLSMTLTNVAEVGAADLELAISIIVGAPPFEIDAAESDCGSELPPQESCTVTVEFSPQSEASYSGVLRIVVDGQNVNLSLQGRGIEPDPMIFEDRFEMGLLIE